MGKLNALRVNAVSFVDRGSARDPANPNDTQRHLLWKREQVNRAAWDAAYINALPDTSFALVKDGGTKDKDGRTLPRDLRMLPFKDKDGAVDVPHLRNALSRLPQADLTDDERAKAQKVLDAAAKKAGVGQDTKKSDAPSGATSNQPLSGTQGDPSMGNENQGDGDQTPQEPTPQTPPTTPEPSSGDSQTTEKAERVTLSKAEHEALVARITRAEETAKAEREIRLDREFVARAERDWAHAPHERTAFAKAMREVSETCPSAFAILDPVVKGMSVAIEKGELFRAVGSPRTSDGSDSPTAQLQAKAEEIRKAEPTLTREQAMSRAMEQNQGLAIQARNAG